MNLDSGYTSDYLAESPQDRHDFDNLEFGRVFTDFMIECNYEDGKWSPLQISELKAIEMHPGASVLHYGQAIFEGLKGYVTADGSVNIFRLKDNLLRLNKSAVRMAMPEIDVERVMQKIIDLVRMEKAWVPKRTQGSLYVRPVMVATSKTLRAVASDTYKFMVICCPVGFYYNKPLRVKLEKEYGRSAKGGFGFAKAAGNYAGSFMPSIRAKKEKFDQIIWTSINNNYTLEELGAANLFFVKNGTICTPSIRDTILPGITRDTVINIARDKGIEVEEGLYPADDFKAMLKSKDIDCVFATGTAAGITYIDHIEIDGEGFDLQSSTHAMVNELGKQLEAHRYGEAEDTHGWHVIA